MKLVLSIALLVLIVAIVLSAGAAAPVYASVDPQPPVGSEDPSAALRARFLADQEPAQVMEPMSFTPCVAGMAGIYPCSNVDLGAFLPNSTIGGGNGSSIWGWTDPFTGKEYALMGRSNGTAFVDISNPASPIYLGNLPTATGTSSWRELKAFDTQAYIISDSNGQHGMQVFDLTQLRTVASPPVTFTAPRYTLFGSAHDIAINPDTGFLYVVGISTGGANACSGSLHMIDVSDPATPTFAGCAGSAYTHDTTCVVYHGPDAQHRGKEICINSNGNQSTGGQVVVMDVTNKAAPALISARTYNGAGYVHQGWLTEDHRYFFEDDELDETNFGHNTHTYVWDMFDLDDPVLVHTYIGPTTAIDHNQFIVGNRSYQANYRAGLAFWTSPTPWPPSKVVTSTSTLRAIAPISAARGVSTRSSTAVPSSSAASARGCSSCSRGRFAPGAIWTARVRSTRWTLPRLRRVGTAAWPTRVTEIALIETTMASSRSPI